MDVTLQQGDIVALQADCLIVNLFAGVTRPAGGTGAVDKALNGAISHAIACGDATGAAGEARLLYTNGALAAPRVLVVGLGPASAFDERAARQAAALSITRLSALQSVATVGAIVNGAGAGGQDPEAMARAFALGAQLAAYRPPSYPAAAPSGIRQCTLVEFDADRLPALATGLETGARLARAVGFARDLVNEPPNILSPQEMARRVRAMATRTGLGCEILGEEAMQALGMGLVLGVSQGSAREAQLAVLKHEPPGADAQAPLVFIGKGITFDTGGISIKPAAGMAEMKADMAGAAAVAGAMQAIADLALPRKVYGLAICVENMPDGNAYRPGDVLTGMTGKTAEIVNTDAEGRLILADCLGYVQRFAPRAVVDLATLTGAIGIALGDRAAGLFSNDAELERAVVEAARVSGDRVWPMPMYSEYAQSIQSDVAQVKNAGSRTAGVSSSAKFLEHFTEGYPWAHLDIAYMALKGKGQGRDQPKGATGYGVQLLAALAARL